MPCFISPRCEIGGFFYIRPEGATENLVGWGLTPRVFLYSTLNVSRQIGIHLFYISSVFFFSFFAIFCFIHLWLNYLTGLDNKPENGYNENSGEVEIILLEGSSIMYTRQNLSVSLVLAISMVGISYGVGGDMGAATEPLTNGSAAYPYLIEDLTDFDVFADPANAATYWSSGVYTKLTCDPNLAGKPYTTAVIAPDTDNTNLDFNGIPFRGIFDGDGHLIRNLTIDTAGADNDFLGLFGQIGGSSTEIKNLGIENINITGGADSDYLGGLCGSNYDTITTNCYTAGSVTGDDYLGGLCGYKYRGTINNCFWDVETSGMTDGVGNQVPDPAGVIGKTTEQMQTQSTFTDASWDFTSRAYLAYAVSGNWLPDAWLAERHPR